MASITTAELVTKIFNFCQAYSGVEFFPYQAQFGKRIIRSVLDNDGEEITALFSRQCVYGEELVHMPDGTRKAIKDISIGEEVLAFDYDSIVTRKVIDAYEVGLREIYLLELECGESIRCTANHRFLDYNMKLFRPLGEFEYGDEIVYVREGNILHSHILNITHLGQMNCYDLEVEGAENFICSNVLVHNSGK